MVFKALGLDEVIEGTIRMKKEEGLKNFLKILTFGSCIGKKSTVKNENKRCYTTISQNKPLG